MLQLGKVFALKLAKIHLVKPLHGNLPGVGKQDRGRLPGAQHGRNTDGLDLIRPGGRQQGGAALFTEGLVRSADVAVLPVAGGHAVADEKNIHGNTPDVLHKKRKRAGQRCSASGRRRGRVPFSTRGSPHQTCTTVSARAASRQARRPAASRAARWAGSMGTTPPPSSVASTSAFRPVPPGRAHRRPAPAHPAQQDRARQGRRKNPAPQAPTGPWRRSACRHTAAR